MVILNIVKEKKVVHQRSSSFISHFTNKHLKEVKMSMNYLLWKRFIIYGGGIIGTGVLLFKFTTPTDEQLIARLSPELKLDYLKNRELRRKEQEELIKLVKKTSASNDPIWRTGDLKSPWERDGSGKSMLVVKEEFNKAQAQELQKMEIEASKLAYENLLKQKEQQESKKRWFW